MAASSSAPGGGAPSPAAALAIVEADGKIGDDVEDGLMSSLPNSSSSSGEPSSTLDEPVSETILRDLKQVGHKLRHVLVPNRTQGVKELRNWDLWGPLLLCILLAASLSFSAKESQTALVFASVFVIVWCGAALVTVNAALLGGKISFFQSVCVLGYCICPLNVASFVCHFWANQVFQLIVVSVCFLWSTRASVGFMAELVQEDRRALAVYPLVLFYLAIGWLILVQ